MPPKTTLAGMLCPPLCKDSSLGECSSSLDICLGGGTPVHAMLTFLGESWPSPQGVQEFAVSHCIVLAYFHPCAIESFCVCGSSIG